MITQAASINLLQVGKMEKIKSVTLKYSAEFMKMDNRQKKESLTGKIQIALDKAIQKVIAETKAKNSYLVIADKQGNIKKIPAKDL